MFIFLAPHRDIEQAGIDNPEVDNTDIISTYIKEVMMTKLNQEGMNALESGRFADMICWDIRNKYRNPPAHTKYVNLDTAVACKSYVESILSELYSYMK